MGDLDRWALEGLVDSKWALWQALRKIDRLSKDWEQLPDIPTTTIALLDDGGEISGGGYSRQAITFAPSGRAGYLSNTNTVTFSNLPACSISAVEIVGAAVPVGMLFLRIIITPRTVASCDSFTFMPGSVQIVVS